MAEPAPLSGRRTSGLWGVFARADHPEGYGMAHHTAHGYVVLFVACKDSDELDAVARRLYQPFAGLPDAKQYSEGYLGDWYGGRFDLIASVADPPMIERGERFRSFGDNRFAGVFEAEEVLSA